MKGPGPLGEPGLKAEYAIADREGPLPPSVVSSFVMHIGEVTRRSGHPYQWLGLEGRKASGGTFCVWLLARSYPSEDLGEASEATARYIFRGGESSALEFRHRVTGGALLPQLGAWRYLLPRSLPPEAQPLGKRVRYLGHAYSRLSLERGCPLGPPKARILRLRPDLLIGPAHNTRSKDDVRRYDDSDYELVRLEREDYDEMIRAGISLLRVDAEQAKWIEERDVFYWGLSGPEIDFPEHLYRSNYLGPTLFLDEPAVCTRDRIIRPRLEKDAGFRRRITVQDVLTEFKGYFHGAKYDGSPTSLVRSLAGREDVDLGDMNFLQANIFSWETMVSTAAYQLTEGDGAPPSALVFEPPARVGTVRTLPEMNMAYGCQLPIDDPKNLTDIIYGFLRGAARQGGRSWGMSIYGQVHRSDAFWYQTHAYDLGATHFLYWDTYQLACVPYGEILALSRNLSAHAESHPERDLEILREAAETAILLPPGYNLGHVEMGRGNLWGLGELNLERRNRLGVKHRVIMRNLFTEIERCIRLGIPFDLLWDLDGIDPSGYREVVRIREDGKLEVELGRKSLLLRGPRVPDRPPGNPPDLKVEVRTAGPFRLTASARVAQTSCPVYYTLGANAKGVYRNDVVLWELFGPGEEDYHFLNWEARWPRLTRRGRRWNVELTFGVESPGAYRLRAAVCDLVGRTSVVWREIEVDRRGELS